MTKNQRGGLAGAVFHPDHGSVHTSGAFQDTCRRLGLRQSMGAIGTSADNALAESFNAALKREVLQDAETFTNQLVCRRDVFRWCIRYNTVSTIRGSGPRAPTCCATPIPSRRQLRTLNHEEPVLMCPHCRRRYEASTRVPHEGLRPDCDRPGPSNLIRLIPA